METRSDGKWINGAPASDDNKLRQVGNLELVNGEADVQTGSILDPVEFLATMTVADTVVNLWKTASLT